MQDLDQQSHRPGILSMDHETLLVVVIKSVSSCDTLHQDFTVFRFFTDSLGHLLSFFSLSLSLVGVATTGVLIVLELPYVPPKVNCLHVHACMHAPVDK